VDGATNPKGSTDMPSKAAPSTTWTATPQEVERVVAAVLPHTAADSYYPTITCVRVEIVNEQFIAVATDRYTMGVAWAKLTDWEEDAPTHQDATASIFADDFRRLFAFLRPRKRDTAIWTLTEKGLTAAIGEESLTVRTAEVDYVKWRPILQRIASDTSDSIGVPVMRFTPAKIDSFLRSAKALGEGNGRIWWHYGPKSTDAPLIRIGDNFVGLLMPQRIDDERPALDLSAIGIESPKSVAA
jgi:hypothetical protein